MNYWKDYLRNNIKNLSLERLTFGALAMNLSMFHFIPVLVWSAFLLLSNQCC